MIPIEVFDFLGVAAMPRVTTRIVRRLGMAAVGRERRAMAGGKGLMVKVVMKVLLQEVRGSSIVKELIPGRGRNVNVDSRTESGRYSVDP